MLQVIVRLGGWAIRDVVRQSENRGIWQMSSEERREIKVEVHRRKGEFLRMFRKLARDADEAGFRSYLSDECGIEPGNPQYPAAIREFWNLVRALEHERRR
jgi:hypothetical protein